MEAITPIVEKMLEPIIEASCTSIGRQFGYLIHCKKSINEFEDEVDKLSLVKERIQTSVDSALQNAEDIHNEVLQWQRKVQSMEDDRRRLLQGKENLKCVDVCSRYRLGKEGKKKKTVVTRLIDDGNNFVTVGHRPPLTGIWHRTNTIQYENFDSRELVFNRIMEAIKDDTNYKIGIHGMPGAGKTRMMKEVAQQAEKERLFDEIVEIVVTQNPNLKDLQQKLAEGLNLNLDKETEDARKGLLRERMLKNGKKILVMVDDVWDDQIKLEDIGIPATNDHTMGCKILLTSRRQDVWEAMGVEKEFLIGLLSESEAWSLFKKKVGDSIERHEIRSVAEAVCKECAGLPLAILAVGGAVLNKSKQVWEDVLEQVINSSGENIPGLPVKLYSRIELSYNYLETDDARSIFLLCALFGEDAEISIDDLVSYGVGSRLFQGVYTMKTARNRAHAIVNTLKVSSLLLEGRNEKFVKMHDVIRDVAISIASKKEDAKVLVKAGVEKWPEEDEYKGCRAISLRLKEDCVLPNDLKCPELRTLMLEGRHEWLYHHPPEVPSSFFDGMEKLEVLCLSKMRISTLPSSLKNLRMLRLYDCQLVSLAFLKELRKLEILTIQDLHVKELAPEIGQLDRLRLLDLTHCDNLQISVISSLSQLEELYIAAISLEEVHVPNVMLLPLNELLFKLLIRFKISIGNYSLLRNPFDNPIIDIPSSATKILKLHGIPFKEDFNILMAKAEALCLIQVKGLTNVVHDRYGEGFQDLEYLEVEGCDDMEHLCGKPKSISQTRGPNCVSGSFSKLSVLQIGNCQQLRYLFSTAIARGLAKLQVLYIDDCKILEEIISDDQEVMEPIIFHGLKNMRLKGLPNLRSFYFNMKNTSTFTEALFNDKVVFPALEELYIEGLKRPTTIWDDQSQSFLAKEAQDSFRHSAGRLCAYSHLTSLEIQSCDSLRNLFSPSTARCLVQLQKLKVCDCEKMEEIVAVEMGQLGEDGEEDLVHDDIIVFPQLKHILLQKLPNLRSFCCCSCGSKKQGEETVELNIPRVDALFNHKVAFPALEDLWIVGLKRPTSIWDDQSQLFLVKEAEDSFRHSAGRLWAYSHLTFLVIRGCDSLRNVFSPSTARCLVQLQKLTVDECEKMEEIVAVEMGQLGEDGEEDLVHDEIIVFPQLKRVDLGELPNLKSFCCCSCGSKKQGEETGELNILRVDALFNHKVVFPALEKLWIYGLKRPTTIWDDQSQSFIAKEAEDSFLHSAGRLCAYSHLTSLEIWTCDSLRNVFSPSTARCLVQLQKLEVCFCEKMEEIVAVEMRQLGEDDLVHDDIIVFPQLKRIVFEYLPNLRSFCCCIGGSKKQGEETVELNIPRVDALFNHKVRFPALEELDIYGLVMLGAIWENELSQGSKVQDFFPHLRVVTRECFEKLKNGIPPNALPWLQKLKVRY